MSPMLAFSDALIVSNGFDDEMRQLADRHYSRRTVGARQFLYAGRKLVLRDAAGLVLFAWMYPDESMRMDGQRGYNNAIFRNESPRRSSDIILEAERAAFDKWGPNRLYTYIDPKKVRSANPGYCFKVAGWKFAGISKGGKHLLVKYDELGRALGGEPTALDQAPVEPPRFTPIGPETWQAGATNPPSTQAPVEPRTPKWPRCVRCGYPRDNHHLYPHHIKEDGPKAWQHMFVDPPAPVEPSER